MYIFFERKEEANTGEASKALNKRTARFVHRESKASDDIGGNCKTQSVHFSAREYEAIIYPNCAIAPALLVYPDRHGNPTEWQAHK